MSDAVIETAGQYEEGRARLVALDAHLAAIAAIRAGARAERALGILADADLRDLAPLDDAAADLGYAAEVLRGAIADWEHEAEYGTRTPPSPAVAWRRG